MSGSATSEDAPKPRPVPKGHGHGTHLPALMHYVLITEGPVLELGCGHYSTPVLHDLCRGMRRRLVSVEADPDWRRRFHHLASAWHQFVRSCEQLHGDANWSVALVDHAMDRRQTDLVALADQARFIVVHDTNCSRYGYDLRGFRYRRDFNELSPTVTVVSNFEQP